MVTHIVERNYAVRVSDARYPTVQSTISESFGGRTALIGERIVNQNVVGKIWIKVVFLRFRFFATAS